MLRVFAARDKLIEINGMVFNDQKNNWGGNKPFGKE